MAAATGLLTPSEPKIHDVNTTNAAQSLEARDEPTNDHVSISLQPSHYHRIRSLSPIPHR
jgi:hypothetical protein